MEDFPNVLIIPENDETPEQIVEDYIETIQYYIDNNLSLTDLMYEFFNEVNLWSAKQLLIDQTRQNLQALEDIHIEETEPIELDDDEDY